jgi:hypothetical protein
MAANHKSAHFSNVRERRAQKVAEAEAKPAKKAKKEEKKDDS